METYHGLLCRYIRKGFLCIKCLEEKKTTR